MYTLYILQCADKSFFIGVCKDVAKRIEEHQSGRFRNLPTFDKLPVKIVFQKNSLPIQDALHLKSIISRWTDKEICSIIEGKKPLPILEIAESTRIDEKTIVLHTAYLPPINWMKTLKNVDKVIIAGGERYQKQTYRSRATILAANGPLNLVVPVTRPHGKETSSNEILISYADDWQKDHSKAIISAYGKAPYYGYYGEEIIQLIQTKRDNLVDLNKSLLQFLFEAFDIECKIEIAPQLKEVPIENRNLILPKNRSAIKTSPYYQVLGRDQFEPNLSSLDALFNIGRLPQ